MEAYGPETYGERIAEVYDELFHRWCIPVFERARVAWPAEGIALTKS
jgi:hypothetical protein